MGDTSNLESVAKLLPPEQRERFYLLIQKYRSVPHDDDHLVMLDAMGFIALFMSELPKEIAGLLEKANQKLTDEQSDQLAQDFERVLGRALEVPKAVELQAMAEALRGTFRQQQDQSRDVVHRLGQLKREIGKYSRVAPVLSSAVAASILTLTIAGLVLYFAGDAIVNRKIIVPKSLWPYIELQREGRLSHDEVDGVRLLIIEGARALSSKNGEVVIRVQSHPED